MRDQLASRQAERNEAERQAEVVGRDAEGVEIGRDVVVARGEPLTEQAMRDFEETAGAVEWSVRSEQGASKAA